ncbi:hypothetical protein [Rhodoflexus caldus]|uniref:hypothetical protein n=1 Tax=Rhodoflexus caldus TaxID=2891236 RepID=UPI00202A3EDC|nr:hypothetical protein [Rhodoflexus caldus]
MKPTPEQVRQIAEQFQVPEHTAAVLWEVRQELQQLRTENAMLRNLVANIKPLDFFLFRVWFWQLKQRIKSLFRIG